MFSIGVISTIYCLYGIKKYFFNSDEELEREEFDINDIKSIESMIPKYHNKYEKWNKKMLNDVLFIVDNIKDDGIKRCYEIMLKEFLEYNDKNKQSDFHQN